MKDQAMDSTDKVLDNLLAKGCTFAQIEDRLDWLENQQRARQKARTIGPGEKTFFGRLRMWASLLTAIRRRIA